MKYFILFLIVCGFISTDVEAQTRTSSPPLTIQEEDASPTGTPRTLKVTNGSLTDNGDGTFSLSASGGSGGTTSTADGAYLSGDLTIEGNVSVSQSLTIGDSIFVGGGSANKLVNGVEPIKMTVRSPRENYFYFTGIDAEEAPNGFTLTDVIISRDLTVDTNNVTVTVSKRTNASQALTTIEEITLDSNEWRDEDDGTLTVSAITADDELGFAVNTTQSGASYALRLYGYKNNA